jgi:hypothetical protein
MERKDVEKLIDTLISIIISIKVLHDVPEGTDLKKFENQIYQNIDLFGVYDPRFPA